MPLLGLIRRPLGIRATPCLGIQQWIVATWPISFLQPSILAIWLDNSFRPNCFGQITSENLLSSSHSCQFTFIATANAWFFSPREWHNQYAEQRERCQHRPCIIDAPDKSRLFDHWPHEGLCVWR